MTTNGNGSVCASTVSIATITTRRRVALMWMNAVAKSYVTRTPNVSTNRVATVVAVGPVLPATGCHVWH